MRDEAEHGHLAVGALAQVPRMPADGGGRDGGAGRGDGTGAAQGVEPDHDLVLVGSAGRRGGEHVVGHVGDEVIAGVGPRPFGGEGFDFGDLRAAHAEADVGVGFDVVGTVRYERW